ncbi:MAG TPA: M20/M25/M40 family metallo-hydrolase [Gemmatimonadaceae bacterium]|nr:M20/M25/M40 family metallo-hydrolase [Gemmatimonadaceae bacterium]
MTRLFGAGVLCALALPALAIAQPRQNPMKVPPRPTTAAITAADAMTRVYIFADDSMMGRQTGTVHHDRATNYIAAELKRLGLQPAGDSGTYFQRLPIVFRNLASTTTFTVGGASFVAGKDFLGRDAADFGAAARALKNAPVVYGGVFGDTARMISPDQAVGKVLVFTVPTGWQANRGGLTQRYLSAAGIVVATLDSMPDDVQRDLAQPSTSMTGAPPQLEVPTFFYSTHAMAEAMLGTPLASARVGATGKTITGTLQYSESPTPGSRNVVAVLPGSDPKLRGQYVAIGAHSDHDGVGEAVDHDSLYAFYHIVRPNGADDGNKPATAEDWPKIRSLLDSLRRVRPARRDSIFNGADDDASGSMGLLEVAEAFATARVKPKRSILFVWHVAEEQGLIGARYFTDNPTVPRDSIVANINIDMIGRGSAADVQGGGPGYLQLIGSRRLSTELGEIVDDEGKKFTPAFRFDYQYDANGHPQQFYCRSDHYMYARYGIPVVFMSTGGHAEYHQVTDEPQYLDYDQMARVAQLVYNTAAAVANLPHRLVVNGPKPDPNGQCVQ